MRSQCMRNFKNRSQLSNDDNVHVILLVKNGKIRIIDVGDNKLQIIKIVKDLANVGLKESKNLVENNIPFKVDDIGTAKKN